MRLFKCHLIGFFFLFLLFFFLLYLAGQVFTSPQVSYTITFLTNYYYTKEAIPIYRFYIFFAVIRRISCKTNFLKNQIYSITFCQKCTFSLDILIPQSHFMLKFAHDSASSCEVKRTIVPDLDYFDCYNGFFF